MQLLQAFALMIFTGFDLAHARVGTPSTKASRALAGGDILVVNLARKMPSEHEVLANNCGGHLVPVFNSGINTAVTNLLSSYKNDIGTNSVVWLGGVSEPFSKEWTWTDGSSFGSFTNWSSDFWSSPSKGSSPKYTGASLYSYAFGKWMAYNNGWNGAAVYLIPSDYATVDGCDTSNFVM